MVNELGSKMGSETYTKTHCNLTSKNKATLRWSEEVTHPIKGSAIRLLTDFSSATLEARRKWVNTLKVLKQNKNCQLKAYIQPNYPSRHFQVNKAERIPMPGDLPHNKCSRVTFAHFPQGISLQSSKPYTKINITVMIIYEQL
jgi:hypothetical protein